MRQLSLYIAAAMTMMVLSCRANHGLTIPKGQDLELSASPTPPRYSITQNDVAFILEDAESLVIINPNSGDLELAAPVNAFKALADLTRERDALDTDEVRWADNPYPHEHGEIDRFLDAGSAVEALKAKEKEVHELNIALSHTKVANSKLVFSLNRSRSGQVLVKYYENGQWVTKNDLEVLLVDSAGDLRDFDGIGSSVILAKSDVDLPEGYRELVGHGIYTFWIKE